MSNAPGPIARLADSAASVLGATLRAGDLVARPLRRFVRLAHLRAHSSGTIPLTTQFDGPTHTPGPVQLTLGAHCRLGRDVFFETNPGGRIEIGSRVRINMGCVLVAYTQIRIGDDCLIGEYVSIRDANHGTAVGLPMRTQPHATAAITIGRDVWIARGAVILKGVTLGDGCIVGANSVVTHDVPPLAIVVGAPAREVGRRKPTDAPAQVLASMGAKAQ